MSKFLVLMSLFIIACNPPTIPNIEVNVTQTLSLSEGGRADGVTGICNPVDRVNVSAFPSTLTVGQSDRIDATPKDSSGKPRDPDCDIKSGILWDSNDDVCTVGNSEEFVTTIRAVKVGTCQLKACVENKCGTASFEVK